jgi:hypothetical protein
MSRGGEEGDARHLGILALHDIADSQEQVRQAGVVPLIFYRCRVLCFRKPGSERDNIRYLTASLALSDDEQREEGCAVDVDAHLGSLHALLAFLSARGLDLMP